MLSFSASLLSRFRWSLSLFVLYAVPAARSACPAGEGELVVRIQADGRSDDDFNWWSLAKKNPPSSFLFWREIATETMSTPNAFYEDRVCIGSGEYYFGIFDDEGDGLCFQNRCPRSATAGSLSVKVDGIEIITDQEFDRALEVYFDYPLCPADTGVLVVNVRTDDGADYTYWWVDYKLDSWPFAREIVAVTLDVPNKNYHNIECLEDEGDYIWGLYDCEGDGLCYQGECGGSQGYFHVSLDGATIVEDRDFGAAIEDPFTWPYFCIDEPGTHFAQKPNGGLQAFTCVELADACEYDLPDSRCQFYCDISLWPGGFRANKISSVCKDTCGKVNRGQCTTR